jgi:predicted acylesterase/phospholipase RssA
MSTETSDAATQPDPAGKVETPDTKKPCTNFLCNCIIEAPQEYCSPQCEALDVAAAKHCSCKHPQCPVECDLVMKGGITSGIVYPPLVIKLHQEGYTFRNIGGTSAGAIAAAVTAAAEHGKESGGFEKLNEVREWLSTGGNLRNLFQPNKETAPLMNTLFGYAELKKWKWPPLRIILSFLLHDPAAFIGGALFGVSLAFIFTVLVAGKVDGALHGWGLIVPILFGLLWGVIVGVWHLSQILLQLVPANKFGLCTGRADNTGKLDQTILTDWLSVKINELAGKGTSLNDAPLTFGDLWAKKEPDQKRKEIDLRMMTSNLSQNQPYVLPFEKSLFIFRRDELAAIFPPNIVEHMVQKTRGCKGIAAPEGYYFLPEAKDLPVVFATRLSLSFPLLISMVPLYTISHKAFKNKVRCEIQNEIVEANGASGKKETRELIVLTEQSDDGNWLSTIGKDTHKLKPDDLQHNWFSDGGICSNFPIHFFDAWLPTRPTFGVNLTSQLAEGVSGANPDRKETVKEHSSLSTEQADFVISDDTQDPESYDKDVYLPKPDETLPPEWIQIDGLGKFLETVFRTAQNYRDNMQAMLPSYRERIVQIRLTNEEGGLNLNMDAETIKGVVAKGDGAGDKLNRYFDLRKHQWVRFRVLMRQIEASLNQMDDVMRRYPFYMRTLGSPPLNPGFPYQRDIAWLADAKQRMDQMGELISGFQKLAPPVLFADEAPLPEPVLRVTPEI